MKFLLENAKGDAFDAANLGTLGLKSSVSDALTPDGSVAISFLNASLGYESTVNTSPVSSLGTSNQLNITSNCLEAVSYTHLTLPTKA